MVESENAGKNCFVIVEPEIRSRKPRDGIEIRMMNTKIENTKLRIRNPEVALRTRMAENAKALQTNYNTF